MNQKMFWRRKGSCLDILVMTQMDLSGKQAPAEYCSVPGKTGLPCFTVTRSRSRPTCTLKVLITVIQTEARRLNMTVQCISHGRESLMLRQTSCLYRFFYWQQANMQRCWAKHKFHKIPPRNKKTRSLT